MPEMFAHFLSMLAAIAPVFIIIAVGRFVAHIGMVGEVGNRELTKVLYWVCLPALLIDRLGRGLPPAESVLLASAIGVVVCILVAVLVSLAYRDLSQAEKGSAINGSFRMNGAFVGLPVVLLLAVNAPDSMGSLPSRYLLMMAVMVPFTNALAVLAFLLPGRGANLGSMRTVGKEVLRNPIIIASLLGVLIGATLGERVAKSPPGEAIRFLGEASIPLALLLAGMGLDVRMLRNRLRLLLEISAVKLLVAPALGWALALALGVDSVTTLAIVLLLGAPTAVSAVPMARQLGGDDRLLAGIVVASTLFSPLTLLAFILLSS